MGNASYRSRRLVATAGMVCLLAATLVGAVAGPASAKGNRVAHRRRPMIMTHKASSFSTVSTPFTDNGALLTHVKIVGVLWGAPTGTSTYRPEVTSGVAPSASDFFTQLTGSSYMNLLSEYSVGAQAIRTGTFAGLYTLTPDPPHDGSLVDDQNDIQAELEAHVGVGLPAKDDNTLYVIFTPSDKTVQACDAGHVNCANNIVNFCAYHNSTLDALPIRYAIIPDNSQGSQCGKKTGFGNMTSVMSHEIAEAITDPDPFTGWYDHPFTFEEIADICNQIEKPFVMPNKSKYVVQLVWSNVQHKCVVTGPAHYLGVGDASVVEGDGGQHMLRFPVTLTAPSTTPVPVNYTITGTSVNGADPATAGDDFNDLGGSGVLTFTPGTKGTPVVQYIDVPVNGDTNAENDETLTVTITAGLGVDVVRDTGVGTIVNDDPGSGLPTVGIGDGSALVPQTVNGTVPLSVTLSSPQANAITVKYTVTLGTALNSNLTGAKSGLITIPAGSTGAVVNVGAKATKKVLATMNKTAIVTLSAPSAGLNIGRSVGTATLLAP